MPNVRPDIVNDTLPDLLRRAASMASQRGISIYDRRGQKFERRTYPQVLESARHAAARLAAAGVQPRERILICLPTSWELLEVWFGAVLRGAYPVLVAPPGALGGAAAHARKIDSLVELLEPRLLVCDATTKTLLGEHQAKSLGQAKLPDELPAAGSALEDVPATPDQLAFLQLTSGSTGRQRAVMIRHSNVVQNAAAIARFARYEFGDSNVTWLPLHHDMGLVGCLLTSMAHGNEMVLLRAETFLARPRLWLEAIAKQSSAMVTAPNFAYQLCVERLGPEDVAGLDLSRWKAALTGAEMVRPETCAAFAERFAPTGFKLERFLPCYGMAECTLAASGDQRYAGPRARPVPRASGGELSQTISTGAPVRDTTIQISSGAAPGSFLPDGQIGEIWINGPGVFSGYYNDPEYTRETLVEAAGKTWLRTGDLGFLHDGELYITGRTKDLLIIRGHNLMPHELEWHAESATGGGGMERSGAFSVERGADGEQAVLAVEVSGTDTAALAALEQDIRTRIGQALGLPLADVVFVKRGQLPKTTSGKVQRRELKQRYLDGRIERL